jgi:hypothetical protein
VQCFGRSPRAGATGNEADRPQRCRHREGAAQRAGLDPKLFAGHSLRSGFLTSAAARGASIFKMADQSRHKSIDTLRGYVRDAEIFKRHAGEGLLQGVPCATGDAQNERARSNFTQQKLGHAGHVQNDGGDGEGEEGEGEREEDPVGHGVGLRLLPCRIRSH